MLKFLQYIFLVFVNFYLNEIEYINIEKIINQGDLLSLKIFEH